MSDTDTNREVAKIVGWIIPDGNTNWRIRPNGQKVFFNPNDEDDVVPDYCNDFNAVIAAERAVWAKDWNLRDHYEPTLFKLFGVRLLDADPKERAEALLETIKRFGTK
jgi:hypothetical protein